MRIFTRSQTGGVCELRRIGLVFLSALLVAGCGGGGSSGSSTPVGGDGGGGGGAAIAGISVGEIEGFGSIIVNGVEFETEGAEIEIEGLETASLNDLREGMLVEVEGTFNDDGLTGSATRVRFEDLLEGPVTALVETTPGLVLELTVLGQRVIVENGVTLFDNTPPLSFATLAMGQVLEISGHVMADGTVRATFIELKAASLAEFVAAGGIFEIKGTVSGLAGSSFSIGGLAIDASTALIDGTLANGVLVEVKGNSFSASTLIATSVEVRPNGLGLQDVPEVEIEGFVANLGATTFTLNGQTVDFSAALFRGGLAEDLAEGMKVEVEGGLVSGILQAEKITFKETVRIEDNAAGALSGSSLTLEGLGLTILIDSAITEVRLNDGFQAGDGVKLRGRLTSSGDILAIRIEEVSPNNRVELQGPVTNIADPVVTIIGIAVDTSTISEIDDSGSNFEIEDVPVTKAAFFAALSAAVNPIVKARADLPAPLVWDHIELEMEDD